MANMALLQEKSLSGSADILTYLCYFVFLHRVLLVVCSAVLVLNIWLALRLKWWKMAKLSSKSTWRGLTNTTWNCSNQWKNRLVNFRPAHCRPRLEKSATEFPGPSSHSDYLTPAWEYQDTTSRGDSDETLNEITWAFDSSPSIYRSHIAINANECKCVKETTAKSAKTSRPEKKHHRTRNRTKDKSKVNVKQTDNNRVHQVRKEFQRQTRVRSNSSIPRMTRVRPNSSIPRLKPLNAKQKTLTKITPSPANKGTGRDVLRKLKHKGRHSTRIPVSQEKRPAQTKEDVKLPSKQLTSSDSNPSTDGHRGNLHRVESNLVCKKDSWIWFSRETRPSVENFTTRKMKFQSSDPRVAKLAEEIRRQERMNQDIERNARSMIESSSFSDPRALTFSTEKIAELAPECLFNIHESQRQVRADSRKTGVTNQPINVDRRLPNPFNYRLQRPQNSRSRTVLDQTRDKYNLTKENAGFTSDYFRNTGSVSTTLVSPGRFSKNNSPNQFFKQRMSSPTSPSNHKNVLTNIRQNDGQLKITTDAIQNSPQITGNRSSDERNEQAKTPSIATTHRRFWPRSMSANISGHAFNGMHTFGNHINPTNCSTFKLDMDVSPSPSRQIGEYLPRRCQELTNIPVSGKATSAGKVRSPSCVLSNGESETDSIRPRFVRPNNPRIESVIKREVNSIVSGLFRSPNQSSTSFTQPTQLISTTNVNESTSDLQKQISDRNATFDLDPKPNGSNSLVSIHADGNYNDDFSRLISRIPVPNRASPASLEVPQKDLIGLSSSKMCNFSSSQNSIKRVNIYSPHYYLGKKIAKSCSQKECSTPSDKCQPSLSGHERQLVKELGLSPRRATYTQHFVYSSKLQFKTQFMNKDISTNQNSPFIDISQNIDNLKKEHDIKQEERKSTSSNEIPNQMFSGILSKMTNNKGYNPNSINFESLSCYNDRTTYHSIGSNNSSNYFPSKRYISQNKERHFRGMPYDRLLHRCKLEKLRVSFPNTDKIYVNPDQVILEEMHVCQSKDTMRLDQWKNVIDTENVRPKTIEQSNSEKMHEKMHLNSTDEFTLKFSSMSVFNINIQEHDDMRCQPINRKFSHVSSPPALKAAEDVCCNNHLPEIDNGKTPNKTISPVYQNLDKGGQLMSTTNMDSGYETVSIDVNGSPNESALLTNAGVVSNLDAIDTELSNPSASSSSPDECLSSPELAEINQLSIDDDDSAQETLPPSTSDDNSLWSYDPCNVDKTPECENNASEPLASDNIKMPSPYSETQLSLEKDDTNVCAPKEKKDKHDSQTVLDADLTIETTPDDIYCTNQDNNEYTVDKIEPLATINSSLRDMYVHHLSQFEEVPSLNIKRDEEIDHLHHNQTLTDSSSDENEIKYSLQKLKAKLFVNRNVGKEILNVSRQNNSEISDTIQSKGNGGYYSKNNYTDLLDKKHIVNASFRCNLTLKKEKPDGEYYSSGTSSIESFADEDIVKTNSEVPSQVKPTKQLSEIGSKQPSCFSVDSVIHSSNMSRFTRSQELLQDKSQTQLHKTTIIPKRGVPFSELLKRF